MFLLSFQAALLNCHIKLDRKVQSSIYRTIKTIWGVWELSHRLLLCTVLSQCFKKRYVVESSVILRRKQRLKPVINPLFVCILYSCLKNCLSGLWVVYMYAIAIVHEFHKQYFKTRVSQTIYIYTGKIWRFQIYISFYFVATLMVKSLEIWGRGRGWRLNYPIVTPFIL